MGDAAGSSVWSAERRAYCPPAPEPHPRPLDPIRLVRTLRRNPLECWARPHFEEWFVNGGLPVGHVLIVNHPNAIRRVLFDHADNYQKDRIQRRVLSAGLKDGLLNAEGERWRVQRRVLAPVFARKTVAEFAPAMVSAAEALVERWFNRGEGATIDAAAEMARVTLDALEHTIFADGLGCNPENIRQAMRTYFDTIGKISALDLVGAPDFVPRLDRLRAAPTLRFFESAIDEVIARRRRRLADEQREGVPRDILTLLLSALDPDTGLPMTEGEVRSNILTFIAAGHETTANALTWALFLLSQLPEWQDRVRTEASRELGGRSIGLAERLVETRAVIEEAIRLYPPIAAISRVALGPDDLSGARVERGSLVVISPYVLHRHRRLWSRPDEFVPERFLADARTRLDRCAYLPFGAGPRTCIGSAFALQEATIVLATIVRHFDMAMKPGHRVWPLLRVTLRPSGGLPMIIRFRTASRTARGHDSTGRSNSDDDRTAA
jgi:cytochrome P450